MKRLRWGANCPGVPRQEVLGLPCIEETPTTPTVRVLRGREGERASWPSLRFMKSARTAPAVPARVGGAAAAPPAGIEWSTFRTALLKQVFKNWLRGFCSHKDTKGRVSPKCRELRDDQQGGKAHNEVPWQIWNIKQGFTFINYPGTLEHTVVLKSVPVTR